MRNTKVTITQARRILNSVEEKIFKLRCKIDEGFFETINYLKELLNLITATR